MSLRGKIEDLALPDLLHIIDLSQKSGCLQLKGDGYSSQVLFRDGKLMLIASSLKNLTLGEALHAQHLIDNPSKADTIEIAKLPKYPSEQLTFISTQLSIDLEQVREALQDYTIESASQLFKQKEGSFDFKIQAWEVALREFSLKQRLWMQPDGIDAEALVDSVNNYRPKNRSTKPELPNKPSSEALDLRQALRSELGEDDFSQTEQPHPLQETTSSRGLHLLKSMMSELVDPSSSKQISLLILRFAAEILNRAIIFVVNDSEIRAVGQFGIVESISESEAILDSLTMPLNERSVLSQAIEKRQLTRDRLDPGQWNQHLVDQLGGTQPLEVLVAPIIIQGEAKLLLYGDNLPELAEIGETDSLEIFLNQAALAIEKTNLESLIERLK